MPVGDHTVGPSRRSIRRSCTAIQDRAGRFGKVVGPALEAGLGVLIDDDLVCVDQWGFDQPMWS